MGHFSTLKRCNITALKPLKNRLFGVGEKVGFVG